LRISGTLCLLLTQITIHALPVYFRVSIVDDSSPLSFSQVAPVFLGITFMISLPEAISRSFPQPVRWLEFSGSFLFLLFLKSQLSYDSHWYIISTAFATWVGWSIWRTKSQVDDMTLQAFASGTFIVNIITMEGLSVMDWSPVLIKPIIDHSLELLQRGDVTVWWHLVWLVVGACISIIIHLTSKYEQDSPLHFYGRLVIFLTVDAYCAMRACQCLQRQASVKDMSVAAAAFIWRLFNNIKSKLA